MVNTIREALKNKLKQDLLALSFKYTTNDIQQIEAYKLMLEILREGF